MQRRQSRQPRQLRPEQIEWAVRTRPARRAAAAEAARREKSTFDPQGVSIRPSRRRPTR